MNARKIRILTKKSDSAYVYATLEAHEGLTAYTTLEHQEGEQFRGIELIFAPESESDVMELIADLQKIMWLEVLSKN